MKKMILIAVMVLGVFGCATTGHIEWRHDDPSITESIFRMHQGQCEHEAVLLGYSPTRPAPYNPWASNASNIAAAVISGLSQGMEQAARRSEIFNSCMRAKGYYQVVVQPPVVQSTQPEANVNSAGLTKIPTATTENVNPGSIAGQDEAWRQRLKQRGLQPAIATAKEVLHASPVPSISPQTPLGDSKLEEYCSVLWPKIKEEWQPTKSIGLEATIIAVIGRDGNLGQAWCEKKSGNDLYDEEAMEAIRKAGPFPPLPKELRQDTSGVGIRIRFYAD